MSPALRLFVTGSGLSARGRGGEKAEVQALPPYIRFRPKQAFGHFATVRKGQPRLLSCCHHNKQPWGPDLSAEFNVASNAES